MFTKLEKDTICELIDDRLQSIEQALIQNKLIQDNTTELDVYTRRALIDELKTLVGVDIKITNMVD